MALSLIITTSFYSGSSNFRVFNFCYSTSNIREQKPQQRQQKSWLVNSAGFTKVTDGNVERAQIVPLVIGIDHRSGVESLSHVGDSSQTKSFWSFFKYRKSSIESPSQISPIPSDKPSLIRGRKLISPLPPPSLLSPPFPPLFIPY